MAHPLYGSAQKGRTRFALYCVAVILRRFLCQGASSASAERKRVNSPRYGLVLINFEIKDSLHELCLQPFP